MPAPVVDRDALEQIHEGLDAKGVLPDTHLVDPGYVAADQLLASQNKGVTLLSKLLESGQREQIVLSCLDQILQVEHGRQVCGQGK